MNEQEAIKILNNFMDAKADFVGLQKVIDWLQMKADIIAIAEDCPRFGKHELPYVYDLGQSMRKQAVIELECAIVYPDMEFCFNKALHYGKLARKYLAQASAWKKDRSIGKDINAEND